MPSMIWPFPRVRAPVRRFVTAWQSGEPIAGSPGSPALALANGEC